MGEKGGQTGRGRLGRGCLATTCVPARPHTFLVSPPIRIPAPACSKHSYTTKFYQTKLCTPKIIKINKNIDPRAKSYTSRYYKERNIEMGDQENYQNQSTNPHSHDQGIEAGVINEDWTGKRTNFEKQ